MKRKNLFHVKHLCLVRRGGAWCHGLS